MGIKKDNLNKYVKKIGELLNISTTKEHKPYLTYEYASIYDGYRLILITEKGGYSKVLGLSSIEPRLSYKEFICLLKGVVLGSKYKKTTMEHSLLRVLYNIDDYKYCKECETINHCDAVKCSNCESEELVEDNKAILKSVNATYKHYREEGYKEEDIDTFSIDS